MSGWTKAASLPLKMAWASICCQEGRHNVVEGVLSASGQNALSEMLYRWFLEKMGRGPTMPGSQAAQFHLTNPNVVATNVL